MTQWEYCRISWLTQSVTEEDRRQLDVPGFRGGFREITDGTGASMLTVVAGTLRYSAAPQDEKEDFTDLDGMLTRLGREGWELVSHTQINQSVSYWIFKRPIPS